MEDGVNPDAGNSSLSLNEGAEALTSLLSGGNAEDKREPEREAGEPSQANDADATDQVSEEETEAGQAEQDEPEQSEDAEAKDDQPEEPAKVRFKDGTEVTLEEVERGFMRDADYRRKTMEVADTRKALQSREAEIAQQSQFFHQSVNFAIQLAQANLPQEPDASLLHSDPIGYLQQKADYETRIGQLQQLVSAKQSAEREAQTRQGAEMQEHLRGQAEQLVAAMPELRDQAKATQFSADLAKSIERYGFTAQDLARVSDHRLFLLAKDAMAYQKLKANMPKAQAKATNAPPMQPGARPGPAQAQARVSKENMDRLRRTGSLADGGAVLLDLVKR